MGWGVAAVPDRFYMEPSFPSPRSNGRLRHYVSQGPSASLHADPRAFPISSHYGNGNVLEGRHAGSHLLPSF
jgi:hypothetical protein